MNRLILSASVAAVAVAGLFCWVRASLAEDYVPPAENAQFVRPPAEEIRTVADQILSQPRFRERWSFWQWLREKLFSRISPDFHLDSPFWKFVYWFVVAWCCLALVAILAHLVWTIWTLLGGSSRWRRTGSEVAHFRTPEQLSYDQLVQHMRELAAKGQFRQALVSMMLALLRRLEELGAINRHQSKTNGDYVREYSPAFTGRDGFRQFVFGFDAAIYGRTTNEREAYPALAALFDQLGSDVTKRQEI